MKRFYQIPQDTFESLQLEAGVVLKRFNPAEPNVVNTDIVCATTGGINPTCVPSYVDMGEDVDNCPNNMKELKDITGWEAKMAFTSLGTSAEMIRMSLGAADIEAESGKITPRNSLKDTDFSDVWWVGDKAGGGMVAIRLINALSTSGFSLQTTKGGKGQIAVELTGHYSLADQEKVPMEFYSTEKEDTAETPESAG